MSLAHYQFINQIQGGSMPWIKVTHPLLGGHDPQHLDDLVGHIFEANGQAIAMIRKVNPHLSPCPKEHWEVAMGDVLEALKDDEAAVLYWGTVVNEYVIRIPHSCANLVESH